MIPVLTCDRLLERGRDRHQITPAPKLLKQECSGERMQNDVVVRNVCESGLQHMRSNDRRGLGVVTQSDESATVNSRFDQQPLNRWVCSGEDFLRKEAIQY